MLTTVAWQLADGTVAYALEGSIFVTGAAVQWLRDGLGIIERADQTGPLASSVPDTGGVYLVPAFTGLGAPWWDPYARAAIFGITRGTTRAHLTRAVVESMAYQVRDVVDAMVRHSGTPLTDLRVDGGASVMDLLLQMQADQLGVTVRRPSDQETTALGAAFLAGLAEGVWPDLDAISASSGSSIAPSLRSTTARSSMRSTPSGCERSTDPGAGSPTDQHRSLDQGIGETRQQRDPHAFSRSWTGRSERPAATDTPSATDGPTPGRSANAARR
jgi:glycerol kinase